MPIPQIEGQQVSCLSWEWLCGTYFRLLTSGAQVLLLVLGAQAQQQGVWLFCLGLIALISVFAWLSNLYRLRMLRNTPASTVAAAAQGPVALNGRGQHAGATPLRSPLKGQPCLWCRYQVETQHEGEWRTQDRGETITAFVLRDRTGECLVDPETAEVMTRHRQQWTVGDTRYTEWLLLPGDALQAIGQFRSQAGTHTLSRPAHGQLFLISNLPRGQLLRRFLLWGWLHLGIFFLSLLATGWV